MKKAFLIFVGGVLPLLCAAAPPLQNTIKMVTYFPASYASYQRLYAVDQSTHNETLEPYALSVGLSTDSCKLGLGCNQDVIPLQLKQAIFVQKGNLYLNGRNDELIINVEAIGLGPTPISLASLSADPANHTKTLTFKKNLRLASIDDKYTASVKADNASMNELRLFNQNALAPCSKVSSSNGVMKWKPLVIKGTSTKGMFLTCGSDSGAGGQCPAGCYKWREINYNSPSGQCGGNDSFPEWIFWVGQACTTLGTTYNSGDLCISGIVENFTIICDYCVYPDDCPPGGGGGGGGDTPGTGSGTITPGHDNNN